MKDPFTRDSVILDSEGMSIIFTKAPLTRPRWSQRLGYGMGVVGEDTRVHLHANGKYVIRRALDRDHAEKVLELLEMISIPNIYSTHHDGFLWELVRDMAFDRSNMDDDKLLHLFHWGENDDAEGTMKGAVMIFRELTSSLGPKIDARLVSGEEMDPSKLEHNGKELEDILRSDLEKVLAGETMDRGRIIGISAFLILVKLALDDSGP